MMFALFLLLAADDAPKPMVAPTITAAVEPQQAEVGDPVVLRVTVKHAEADAFEFPNEVDWTPFELVDKAASQAHDGPMITEEMVFKLAAYETGEQAVPGLSFKVGGGAFTTDALDVQIVTSITDAKGTPERAPDGAPLPIYERLMWPLYALAGCLFGAALWLLIRRMNKPKPQVEAAAPIFAPHEAALMLYKMLRKKDLLSKGDVREFYFEATEILRAYLSQRYAINALDLTTSELMLKLANLAAPGLERDLVRQWLEHADLVKFAKLSPPIDAGANMIDFFEAQVWATRPPAPKAVVAGAA